MMSSYTQGLKHKIWGPFFWLFPLHHPKHQKILLVLFPNMFGSVSSLVSMANITTYSKPLPSSMACFIMLMLFSPFNSSSTQAVERAFKLYVRYPSLFENSSMASHCTWSKIHNLYSDLRYQRSCL